MVYLRFNAFWYFDVSVHLSSFGTRSCSNFDSKSGFLECLSHFGQNRIILRASTWVNTNLTYLLFFVFDRFHGILKVEKRFLPGQQGQTLCNRFSLNFQWYSYYKRCLELTYSFWTESIISNQVTIKWMTSIINMLNQLWEYTKYGL